jgi:threonine dehydrogenase-like Zn-dependent dehydrogenase
VGATAGVLASSARAADVVKAKLGADADVVFDCVANQASLAQGVDLLRRAGTLLVVGVPPRPAEVNLPIIQDWELRLQGCAAYTEQDIVASLDIAVEGGLPTAELVSAEYPLPEAPQAFAAAAAPGAGKVLVQA